MLSFIRWTVFAFSVILILVGVFPLLHLFEPSPTSNSPAYAWFHLIAAGAALVCFANRGLWAPWFALGFGIIDLYQWVASMAGWFPLSQFRWTPVDDGLHLGIGLALVALGLAGLLPKRSQR